MKFFRFVTSILLLSAASSSFAAPYLYTETADKVRFEQYASGSAPLVLWRMPTPGTSTFPGGTCVHIDLPTDAAIATVTANRFLSMYMFVKTNASSYFVQYEPTTCQIISFGMDN